MIEDDFKVMGNAYHFIKGMMLDFVKDPRILYTIVRSRDNYCSLRDESLIESLSFSLFENLLADDPYEKKLLNVLAQLVKIEFEKPDNYKQIFRRNSFAEKMLLSYLKRRECQKYTKFTLRRPLLEILRDSDLIELDINNLEVLAAKMKNNVKYNIKTAIRAEPVKNVAPGGVKHVKSEENLAKLNTTQNAPDSPMAHGENPSGRDD
jgi:hypothetical protein